MIPRRPPLSRLLGAALTLGLAGWMPAPLRATGAPAPAAHAGPRPAPAARQPAADEAHGLLNLGTRLTDRGDYESAEIAFRQILNARGAAPDATKSALLGLARLHRKQGALTKAAAIYEKFLKEFPGDEHTPDALLELGRTLRAMGAHRLALSRFYSVINSTLKLPAAGFEHYQLLAKTAQFEIAETHFQAGDFAEAGRFFARLRLLDLAPADRARAHFKAAYSLHLQGDHEGATTMLRAYLEQWPDDENVPEARHLLATGLRTLGRTQEAMAVTLELLRKEQARPGADPKRWIYWQRRTGNELANDFFEHGDLANAQALYGRLAALSEDPAWRLPVSYQLALCHERLGDVARAQLAYQGIVDAAKQAPTPELAELGRLAAWRLGHLAWNDALHRQVTSIFETTTGRAPPPPAAPRPPASHL